MTLPSPLRAVIERYPRTEAFLDERTNDGRLNIEFTPVKPVVAAFKPMVRELRFDVCEMALATFLMARDRHVPLKLIPATLVSRPHHPSLLCHVDKPIRGPEDLIGRRVGIRSYSQTSGVWVRGFLQNDYGIDIRKIRWVTFEDTHVSGFVEPGWTERANDGSGLVAMGLSGQLDAIIADLPPHPLLRPVFTDADRLGQEWPARHSTVPVSHMVVLREQLAVDRPSLCAEIYRQLLLSRKMAGFDSMDRLFPFGAAEAEPALAILARFAFQQGLVSRLYDPGDLLE